MDKDEKNILHRIDEKVDNLESNQKEIRKDVRTNREVYTTQVNDIEDKAHSNGEEISANKVRIAGLGFGLTSLIGIALNNAGLLPL